MARSASKITGGRLSRGVGRITAWASSSAWRRGLVALLVAVALLAPGFDALGPTDRDEARFAQATKQMLETGDFIDIRLQEDARHKKPAGIYWLQAAAASAVAPILDVEPEDAPIWAYRLPSLIGGVLASLLTIWAVRPLVGPRAAFVAGIMTAALALMSFEARTAKADAFLLAAIVAAMGALARLWFGRADDPKEHGWNVFFFWTALAIGVLIKGPIIFLPVGGALLWMCLRERSLSGLRWLGWSWGLPWFLLLALPWFIAIAVKSDGAFFAEAIGEDLGGKLTDGAEGHGAPPGTYLIAFWGTFWPWTALALMAAPHVWNWRRAPETAFLLGWILPTWVVFELVATKLPHYVLPTYPALCALVAAAALDGGAQPKGRLFWLGAVVWAIPAFGMPLVFGLAPSVIEGKLILPPMIGAGVALLVLIAAWRWLLRGVWIGFIRASIVGAGVLYATVYWLAFPAITPPWISERLSDIAAPYRACLGAPDAPAPLASVGYSEPSLVFLAGTETAFLDASAAARRLAFEPTSLVWVESAHLEAFKAAQERLNWMTSGGVELASLAETTGFQYNGGDERAFTLFANRAALEAAECPITEPAAGDDRP